MELVKNKLITTITKASKYIQFTIDDDFNVPDVMGDIEKIIASYGNVIVEDTEVLENKVRVMGVVTFKTLYQPAGNSGIPEAYSNEIFFEEAVNIDGIYPGDKVEIMCTLEDLYVTMINSRKLEARGLVGMKLWACSKVCVEGVTGIANGAGIECKKESIPFTNNVAGNKDILKLKEDIELPGNKPNIGTLIWDQVCFKNIESKVVDGGVHVRGDMELFVIYSTDDNNAPLQYVCQTRAFENTVDCQDASAGMILDDYITPGKGTVSVRADEDGEDRVLQVEYNLCIDMKIYEDMELCIVADMFSPSADIHTDKEEFCYENLLMKNNAKTKVSHREKLKSGQPQVLQIAYISGNVEVDDIKFYDDSIGVNGAVKAVILYISSDDKKPLCQMEAVIPFSYQVETSLVNNQDYVRIMPSIDQITASLNGSDEVEIKAVINMNISVFSKKCQDVITDIQILPVDLERKARMPGIVGYMVQEGDSIWSIAKNYYSSLDSIRSINKLTSDDISPGDKLIIVKSVSAG